MKINTIGHLVKTNPIQTQSNPISERPKMNISKIITMNYKNISRWRVKKNKPNSNPISLKAQNERKLICHKGL
jgi:hypothetical protein